MVLEDLEGVLDGLQELQEALGGGAILQEPKDIPKHNPTPSGKISRTPHPPQKGDGKEQVHYVIMARLL